MGCRFWPKIDACLDEGRDFPPSLRDHLEGCNSCSRRLVAYRRFLIGLGRELDQPLSLRPASTSSRRRSPSRLLAAAGVFSLCLAAGSLLLPSLFEARSLKVAYARELAAEAISGSLFEYAESRELSYGESDWFD